MVSGFGQLVSCPAAMLFATSAASLLPASWYPRIACRGEAQTWVLLTEQIQLQAHLLGQLTCRLCCNDSDVRTQCFHYCRHPAEHATA